jgi:hypothetical protein
MKEFNCRCLVLALILPGTRAEMIARMCDYAFGDTKPLLPNFRPEPIGFLNYHSPSHLLSDA